jgi:hypothetical protein
VVEDVPASDARVSGLASLAWEHEKDMGNDDAIEKDILSGDISEIHAGVVLPTMLMLMQQL